jgi:hypothetical protein
MNRVRELTSVLSLDLIINCILVKNGVRNAFLIQPADYGEALSSDAKTSEILKYISRYFPELIQSNISGETLISKIAYRYADIKTDADMGKIIGYPCAEEYQNVLNRKDEQSFSISIDVKLKPGYNTDNIQILVYRCRDLKTLTYSQRFAKDCEHVLKADPDIGIIIDSVDAVDRSIVPIKFLINKLLRKEEITEEEDYEIKNHIWNLGFDDHPIVKYKYDYNNSVHRGLLIGILTLCNNNPMEPFWPLQHRKEQKAVDKINIMWADDLLHAFTESNIKRGGRKSRKIRG